MNLKKILCALLSAAVLFISPGLGCYQALAAEAGEQAGGLDRVGPENFALGSGNSQEQSPSWQTPSSEGAVNLPEELSLPSFESEGDDSKNLAKPDQDSAIQGPTSEESKSGEPSAQIGANEPQASSGKKEDQGSPLNSTADKASRSEAFRQAAIWRDSGEIVMVRTPEDLKRADRAGSASSVSKAPTAKPDDLTQKLLDDVLLLSAQEGSSSHVKAMVEQGADVNAKGEKGTTALHWAVYHDNLKMVRFLLGRKANVNAQDAFGFNVIGGNARKAPVVKLLLDHGFNPNTKSVDGFTALMWSARAGNIETTKLLLDRGADVNDESNHGQNALLWAAKYDGAAVVQLLMDRGANKLLKAFFAAGDFKTATLIAKEGFRRLRNSLGNAQLAALGLAIGSLVAAHLMPHLAAHAAGPTLSLAAVTPVSTNSGQNPELNKELLGAAAKGDTQKVESLLSQGAYINARDDSFGLTPLMRAIRGGHFETARLIARRALASRDDWAPADEKDNSGRTALMHAANAGRLDMVKFLVEECGADTHATDNEGRTVMDYAPVSEDPGIARYLAQGPRTRTDSPTGLGIAVKFLRNAFFVMLWCVILKLLLR